MFHVLEKDVGDPVFDNTALDIQNDHQTDGDKHLSRLEKEALSTPLFTTS